MIHEPLERRALFGAMAMAAASVAKVVFQLMVLPVLAHLLEPDSFGLVALAMPFILVTQIVCDLGLGNAIVRASETSRELESTVFWLGLLIASGLALLVCVLCWPASWILGEPRLPPILMTMSLLLPFGAGLSVVNARVARERRFSLFAANDFMATILSSCLAILAALAGCGAWSLVVQLLTIWIFKAVWLGPRSGFRPTFVFRPQLAWPHLRFGLNAVGSSVADLGAKGIPPLIVGGFLGVTGLGYYSMANQLVRVPELVISTPLFLSIFTAVAHSGDNDALARPVVLRGLRGTVTGLLPLFCGLVFVSRLVVPIFLGAKWATTNLLVSLLAPAGFFVCLYSFVNAVLMGLGQSDKQFRLTLLAGLTTTLGALVGVRFGSGGVASGLSIGAALAAPAYLSILSHAIRISCLALLAEIAAPVFATVVMGLVLASAERGLGGWNVGLQLGTMVLLAAGTFITTLAATSWQNFSGDFRWLLSASRGRADGRTV